VTDSTKVRDFGKLLLKLETRSKSGSNRKLLLIYISYAITGIFLPLILLKQNSDPTGFEFALLTYLFFSLIIVFTVITDIDNLIISGSEIEIFSSMPLDEGLIVKAKMYMLLRYIVFLTIPLLLPSSIFFYSIVRSFPRAILYIVSGFMLCFFIVNFLLLLYSIALRIFKSKNLASYTLIFQLLITLILIIGYQFISLGITGRQATTITDYLGVLQKYKIIDYMPHAWYALLPARNNFEPGFALMVKAFLPVVICFLSYYSLMLYLAENYGRIREKFLYTRVFNGEQNQNPRFFIFQMFSDFIQNVYMRNNLERSSYGLMNTMYKKDKSARLAVVPMIIIPIGLAIFALITNQLPSPIGKDYLSIKPAFHISILLCVLVVLNTSAFSLKVTNYPGVWWVYDSYPMTSRKHFKNGFRKFFVINFLIPVCIALGLIFMIKIPLDQLLMHILFIFASVNLYNSIYNYLRKDFPFTRENTLANSLQRMASVFYPFLYGIAIVLVQVYVYRNVLSTIIAILAIITINFWFNYFAFVREKPAN
jgi:hypothetical protein